MYKYAIVHLETRRVCKFFTDLSEFANRRPADLYWSDEYGIFKYDGSGWNSVPKPEHQSYEVIVTGPFENKSMYVFSSLEDAQEFIEQFPEDVAKLGVCINA